MLSNEITIDMAEIMLRPPHSVDDPETIRQMSLFVCSLSCQLNRDECSAFLSRIKPGYEVCGLYPHVIEAYDIQPAS